MKIKLKHIGLVVWVSAFLLFLPASSQAQQPPEYKTLRILFVMDASGSMQGKWQDQTKYEIAQEILVNVLDSLERKNDNIEFGLRLFGHLSHKDEKNCEDTRQEIEFDKNNRNKFRDKFAETTPQGQTPIAYSLFQAVNDFPDDPFAKNVIILITDGLESCEGNPCGVAPLLKHNNIALRPFVIGLGLELENEDYFDCVGKFFNANDKPSLNNVMNVVVSQAMDNTTVQLRLLDENGKPTIFNMPVTFYKQRTNDIEKSLYNTEGLRGQSDTIYLPPVNNYDIQVHSLPPVWKRDVEIHPGKHNIIAIDLPMGYIHIKRKGFRRVHDANCVLRDSDHELLKVFQVNNYERVLRGKYSIEILTLPPITRDVIVKPGETETIEIPTPGKVIFSSSRPGIYSIYTMENGEPVQVYENDNLTQKESVEILPGEYYAVFRQYKYKSAELTEVNEFKVSPGSTTSIWF